MFPKLQFKIDEYNKIQVTGLPSHLKLRGIKYPSKHLAALKHLSIASANMMAAKFYMELLKTVTPETDPHLLDAVLLSAIVKYGSVFKPDSKGRLIDATEIFKAKVRIVNKTINEDPIEIDDPDLTMQRSHQRIIKIRDQVIAHDDRIIGNTECFAAFDDNFNCKHVVVLTQRSSVYSAIKDECNALLMCIDAVFTWLAEQKERYCQLVNDEINALALHRREKFPDPIFENYRGLPDAEERKKRPRPYWVFDWDIGDKQMVSTIEEITSDS